MNVSIETLLAANTAALEANTAALLSGGKAAAKGKASAGATETAAATASGATASTTATAPAGPDLKAVADVFMALAAKNRDAAVAIIAGYGAAKLSEVAPAKLGEVLAKCNAALNPAPEQSSASSLI